MWRFLSQIILNFKHKLQLTFQPYRSAATLCKATNKLAAFGRSEAKPVSEAGMAVLADRRPGPFSGRRVFLNSRDAPDPFAESVINLVTVLSFRDEYLIINLLKTSSLRI